MMHPVYLPFSEQDLGQHFAKVKKGGKCAQATDQHLKHYRDSLANYKKCSKGKEGRKSLKDLRKPCQVEKDEKFWTAGCLMTVYHGTTRLEDLYRLFQKAFGPIPPIDGLSSWEEGFGGDLHLFFEANLPSPRSYKEWLRKNLKNRQFIPYILDSDDGRKNLEGPTNVDAIFVNSENGFAVVIEAKVLSDISHDVTYDVMRNQIARNIDVMLEDNGELCAPLDMRKPERTLFLLLTPRIFKSSPTSRLYGYKFNEYRRNPNSIGLHLPHRKGQNWEAISRRLGWLTWEDFKEVNPLCCRWLDTEKP
jgi:hypothetical protein